MSVLRSKLNLLLSLAKMDLKKQFLDTHLGILWAFLMPLTTIAIIFFVMTYGLKAGRMESVDYVYWLVAGMLIWFFLSDSIVKTTSVIVEHSYLVTKVQFPLHILVAARIAACLPIHIALLVLFLCVASLTNGLVPSLYWLQCVYYLFCAIVLSLGIVLATSALQVFVRDVSSVVGVAMQVFFWMTPLFWDAKLLDGSRFTFILFSPFAYIVSGYRDSLFRDMGFWLHPVRTAIFWLTALCLLGIGITIFNRTRAHFADVL